MYLKFKTAAGYLDYLFSLPILLLNKISTYQWASMIVCSHSCIFYQEKQQSPFNPINFPSSIPLLLN